MILIIKTGQTFDDIRQHNGDFEDWIVTRMGLVKSEYHVHSAGNYENLPLDLEYAGIIITGSPMMVTDLNWSTSKFCKWLRQQQDDGVPMLGICFGHQLLNLINGGTVNYIESGYMIGSSTTSLTNEGKDDELLGFLPETFGVFKAHKQHIHEPPKTAVILGINNFGIIDAIRFAEKSWGVQFHPEFDPKIMKLYIQEERISLILKGFNIDQLLTNVAPDDYGESILKRFNEIIDHTSN